MLLLVVCSVCLAEPMKFEHGEWQRDWPEVAKIEQQQSDAVSLAELKEIAANGDRNIADFWVLRYDHKVIGYVIHSNFKVLKIAVDKEYVPYGAADALASGFLARAKTLVKETDVRIPANRKNEIEAFERQGMYVQIPGPEVKMQMDSQLLGLKVSDLAHSTYYELLGVPENASQTQIDHAFKKRNSVVKDEEVKKLFVHAHAFLSSSEKRKQYDEKKVVPRPSADTPTRTPPKIPKTEPAPQSRNLYRRLNAQLNASETQLLELYEQAKAEVDAREKNGSLSPKSADVDRSDLERAISILGRPSKRKDYDDAVQLSRSEDPVEKANAQVRLSRLMNGLPKTVPTFYEIHEFDPDAGAPMKILGLENDATIDDVAKKYRRLRRSIPDLDGQFPIVAMAHDVMSDPGKREEYKASEKWDNPDENRLLLETLAISAQRYTGHNGPVEPSTKNRSFTYYDLFGVPAEAPLEKIREAYEKKKPFIDKDKDLNFKKAYAVLSDPKHRATYDSALIQYTKHPSERPEALAQDALYLWNSVDMASSSVDNMEKLISKSSPVLKYDPDLARYMLMHYREKLLKGDLHKKLSAPAIGYAFLILAHLREFASSQVRAEEKQLCDVLITSAIARFKNKGKELDRLLADYLIFHSPDDLSQKLREARDAVAPPPPLTLVNFAQGCDVTVLLANRKKK